MDKNTNKQCRLVLLSYVTFVAAMTLACVVLLLVAIDRAEVYYHKVDAVMQEASKPTGGGFWQEYNTALQERCGLALDQVAASMPDEEFDSIPTEVWQSAYQQCLFDSGATL